MAAINEIINYKGDIAYYNTPTLFVDKPVYKHQSEIPLMYFSLFVRGNEASVKTVSSNTYYCPDCKTNHFTNQEWHSFKHKYSKFFPILHKIKTECLY